MKTKIKFIFLFVLNMCILIYIPLWVQAETLIQPPTGVKTDSELILLGWPGMIPSSVLIQWEQPETEELVGYNIYEVIIEKDGTMRYVKLGNVNADETEYKVRDEIFGCHRFVITSVIADGRESDYSEMATSRVFDHLCIRNVKVEDSSISLGWDAPEFQEAEEYEIWYCEDKYQYWEYYGKEEDAYEKVSSLAGDVKSYTINGLKPDTEYVFSVRAYSEGKVLDRSDFKQVKTTIPEWTKAIVYYKDSHTGEMIGTKLVEQIKTGDPFCYEPEEKYTSPKGKVYLYDRAKTNVPLEIKKLSWNPEDNVITVYYTENIEPIQEKRIKIERVKLQKPVNMRGGKIKLRWKRNSGVKGYQITYADNKKFKRAKKKTTGKNTFTIKKVKKGKTYYVKIRAYKLDSAKRKVYGKYSRIQKLKIHR